MVGGAAAGGLAGARGPTPMSGPESNIARAAAMRAPPAKWDRKANAVKAILPTIQWTDPPVSRGSCPLWQRATIIDKAVRSDRQAPNANVGGLS
jgi:hypothetical protein